MIVRGLAYAVPSDAVERFVSAALRDESAGGGDAWRANPAAA
jgi:hypothetical protein